MDTRGFDVIAVKVKPLSVNKVWQGRRFKTKEYKAYEQELMLMLPKIEVPEGELSAYYEFGQSSKLADWDNPVKPFQDVLQKKYGFDDRNIVEALVKKVIVPKGAEYIGFRLEAA